MEVPCRASNAEDSIQGVMFRSTLLMVLDGMGLEYFYYILKLYTRVGFGRTFKVRLVRESMDVGSCSWGVSFFRCLLNVSYIYMCVFCLRLSLCFVPSFEEMIILVFHRSSVLPTHPIFVFEKNFYLT